MTGTRRPKPITLVQGVHRSLLPNGLTVLTREDHSVPVVTSMVWYRVGSRYEVPGITGMSHFLEHMMFKGTERYGKGEIDLITTVNGGSNNAFTSRDYTAYYFSFASDRWLEGLEIEADRMYRNMFDPEELELERQVILEELRMELDSPWGALRQVVETHAFDAHPYRHPIIGNREDVEAVTQGQMVDFYRCYYSPGNAVLCICGDFEREQALAEVQRLFGCIEPREVPPLVSTPEPLHSRQIRLQLSRPTNLERLFLAFPAPAVSDPDHFAVQILDKLLGEGKLARLYRSLVEESRLASLVTTEYEETADPYLFCVRAELHPGTDASEAEDLLFHEMRRVGEEGPSAEELMRAKNQCLTQVVGDFETTIDQSVQLGLMETLSRFEYWETYPERIEDVTGEDVAVAVRKYLSPERSTIGLLSPDPDSQPPSSLQDNMDEDEE